MRLVVRWGEERSGRWNPGPEGPRSKRFPQPLAGYYRRATGLLYRELQEGRTSAAGPASWGTVASPHHRCGVTVSAVNRCPASPFHRCGRHCFIWKVGRSPQTSPQHRERASVTLSSVCTSPLALSMLGSRACRSEDESELLGSSVTCALGNLGATLAAPDGLGVARHRLEVIVAHPERVPALGADGFL